MFNGPTIRFEMQLRYPEGWRTVETLTLHIPAGACTNPSDWLNFKHRYRSFKTRLVRTRIEN